MRKQDRVAQQQQTSRADDQRQPQSKAQEKVKGSASQQPTHAQREPGSKLPLPD
ncbi:MAG TPA: hypothetical protein VL693_20080 [Vicinamibacterales bacterium]|jgi:hypothetical protein|nr:hypothetical protein [Vicinamibacterales bacterium]